MAGAKGTTPAGSPAGVAGVGVNESCLVARAAVTAAATTAIATTAAAVAAPAAAAAAAVPTPATTAGGTRLPRLGLVDGQGAALEVRAIHLGDRFLGAVFHFHETEAARPAGLAVGDHLRPGDGAELREGFAQVLSRRPKGQVPDVQILRHGHSAPREAGEPPTRKPKHSHT